MQKESGGLRRTFARTFAREDGVYPCHTYLMVNAFSSYPAVGGRGSGASAHRCPHPWTVHTDITRRAKADTESFHSTRSARDLVKMPKFNFCRNTQLRKKAILRLTMSIASGALTRRDHITDATRGQKISLDTDEQKSYSRRP